jgi:valine--pyruvate aminotransferase
VTAELEQLADVAGALRAPMMVDNAYGAPFPAISEWDTTPVQHPLLINSFSVSKAGLPGERLGFAIADPLYITVPKH